MENSPAYQAGYESYNKGLKWIDNPYPQGSGEWQEWNNGRSDKSDEEFLELITICPEILIDK